MNGDRDLTMELSRPVENVLRYCRIEIAVAKGRRIERFVQLVDSADANLQLRSLRLNQPSTLLRNGRRADVC
jgi:hypothetical protein